jgi:hypothetical protein
LPAWLPDHLSQIVKTQNDLAVQVLMDIIEEKHGGNGRLICCHPHPGKNLTPEK